MSASTDVALPVFSTALALFVMPPGLSAITE